VNLVVRHALPVFFAAPGRSASQVTWRVTQKGRALSLAAVNTGDRRVRLASLRIRSGSNTVSLGPGLADYALGH
jgi:fimbrial chaperone protein